MARRPGPSAPARGKGSVALVNIHEPGPLEGRLDQWPVLAASGALEVRLAETEAEIEAAQRLRYHIFYEEMSGRQFVQTMARLCGYARAHLSFFAVQSLQCVDKRLRVITGGVLVFDPE